MRIFGVVDDDYCSISVVKDIVALVDVKITLFTALGFGNDFHGPSSHSAGESDALLYDIR